MADLNDELYKYSRRKAINLQKPKCFLILTPSMQQCPGGRGEQTLLQAVPMAVERGMWKKNTEEVSG